MHGKVVRHSKDHKDVYVYDREKGVWRFVSCRLGGNWDRCTASHADLPRGTKFDGTTTLEIGEEANAGYIA